MRRLRLLTGVAIIVSIAGLGTQPAFADTASITSGGRVTIRIETPGATTPVRCTGGLVAYGATVSAIPCSTVTSVRIVGTAGPDTIDTSGMRSVDFPALRPWTTTSRPVDIEGKEGADTLVGGWLFEMFAGGPGDDVIDARGGDDLVFGGAGNDRITGGDGLDRLNGDSGNDTIVSDAAPSVDDGRNDSAKGGTGIDTFRLTNGDSAAVARDTPTPDDVFLTFTRHGGAGNPTGPYQVWYTTNAVGAPSPVVHVTIAIEAIWELRDDGTGSPSGVARLTEIRPGFRSARWYASRVIVDFSGVEDDVSIIQSPTIPFDLNGNGGVADILRVTTTSPTYTDTGTSIESAGGAPITYTDFEGLIINGG